MSYYNTTHLTGRALKDSIDKAATQGDKVLIYFKNTKENLTPSEVWKAVFDIDSTPLTSVRRAMTDLTKEGRLSKTDDIKKEGVYGKPYLYNK